MAETANKNYIIGIHYVGEHNEGIGRRPRFNINIKIGVWKCINDLGQLWNRMRSVYSKPVDIA